jgi:hypothetical protein
LDSGIQAGIQYLEKIYVGYAQKKEEERERNGMIRYIKSELVQLSKKLEKIDEENTHDKDVIQMHMLQKQDEIEELENENMDEARFWGMIGLGNEDEDFDYGRDFLKEQGVNYDRKLVLPYEALILFLKPDWYKSSSQKEII